MLFKMNFTAIFFVCFLFVLCSRAIDAANDTAYSKPINGQCPYQCFKVIGADNLVQCDCCGSEDNGTPFLGPCAWTKCWGCINAMCRNETECGSGIQPMCGTFCKEDASPCPEGTTEVPDNECDLCVRGGQTSRKCKRITCPYGCYKYLGRDGCFACNCCNGCVNKKCGKGLECVLREVFCKKAPCPPQPSCEKIYRKE